ncbi:unnamed protein product [Linum trigynum]|uniref:Uncharacterized protein n=1 Tax=Linum trigynum TaxID=586398 RepID=A0AAV2GUR2_9ROSI
MGIGEYWCGSPGTETIQLGRKSGASSSSSSSSSSGIMRKARWKLVLLNLVKEKSATTAQYDEFSYALNFDRGDAAAAEAAMDEPEYFRQTFSVRYADPSTHRLCSSNNKNPSLL